MYGVRIMPKPRTHAKRVLLTHNDSHTHKTCFTHAQRFTHTHRFANTKHHSETNAFSFRNKYSMFYTYKETYFFNYKKISSKYKLKSFKNKLKSFSAKRNPSSTQNNSTSTEHWKLRVDLKAFARGSARRKICAKSHVRNKCPVIHTTQQQVALLSQFKAARTIFFSPQNLYWCRPTVCGFYGKPRRPLTGPRMAR